MYSVRATSVISCRLVSVATAYSLVRRRTAGPSRTENIFNGGVRFARVRGAAGGG